MENSNSREYLEKIKYAVIENLRNTVPAPSVQMQDVPRQPFGGMTDEEEILSVYRRVRDEIREFVSGLPGSLD